MELSRRRFAQLAGTAAMAAPQLRGQQAPITAQQVIERIQKNAGSAWLTESADTVKAGDPSAIVTGIVTTAMATNAVLMRATDEKANFVITLEPTFFGRADAPLADDPVSAAKMDLIRKNGLVVFRFSDNWRTRRPDPFAIGLARALAWTKYQVGDDPTRYDLPGLTLGALADSLAKRLSARAGIRVTGDPKTQVKRVGLLPGASTLAATMKALPACDAVVAGETREWESVEYAQDTVASGQKKGFLMIGRVMSQDPGMDVCAEWVKSLVPEVPVKWMPAGDPYWRPTL